VPHWSRSIGTGGRDPSEWVVAIVGMRSFEKVCGEWAIVCTAHNLLKLAQGRTLSAALPQAA
jgi:hypothetical protein